MNKYMEIAYKEAIKAFNEDEIPVGAVVVCNNKIICKGHNDRQSKNNILGHAEINAIIKAEKKLNDWRLDECEMYVTLSPCAMCELIIKESRIKNVYYLLENKNNPVKNDIFIQTNDCININERYQLLLNNFFEKLRK